MNGIYYANIAQCYATLINLKTILKYLYKHKISILALFDSHEHRFTKILYHLPDYAILFITLCTIFIQLFEIKF